jgi:hypothetical protein
MTRATKCTAVLTAALVVGVSAVAMAQSRGGGGGGGGNAGTAAGALYGDLYVIERDGAGVPITRAVSYTDAETGATVTATCVQPLAAGCGKLPLWGECGKTLPTGVLPLPTCTFDAELYDPCAVYESYTDQIQEVKFGRESVSRAPATVLDKSYGEALKAINAATEGECACDVPAEGCTDPRAIKLDPAGRVTLCLASETDPTAFAWKTIDAPLENLGLYRGVMTNGCLGAVTEETVGEEGVRVVVTTALDPTGIYYLGQSGLDHLLCQYPAGYLPLTLTAAQQWEIDCPVTPDPVGTTPPGCWWEKPQVPDRGASGYLPGQGVTREDMLSAAVFLAAGADKTSPVTLDEIVNVNNYVGVNLWSYTRVRKEQVLTVKYFPFKDSGGPNGWFAYDRGSDACRPRTVAPLLAASGEDTFVLKSVDVFGGPPDGVDLSTVGVTVCRDGSPLLVPEDGPVVCEQSSDPYYGSGTGQNGCGGANWFAQSAEDARKTIWYLHNWRAPELAY